MSNYFKDIIVGVREAANAPKAEPTVDVKEEMTDDKTEFPFEGCATTTFTLAPEPAFLDIPNITIPDPRPENIVFAVEEMELILDKDGFSYNGKRIDDAGEAHRIFLEVMYCMRNPIFIQEPSPPERGNSNG